MCTRCLTAGFERDLCSSLSSKQQVAAGDNVKTELEKLMGIVAKMCIGLTAESNSLMVFRATTTWCMLNAAERLECEKHF